MSEPKDVPIDSQRSSQQLSDRGAGLSASAQKSKDEAELELVDWDGPEDSTNPINWTSRKRWTHVIMVAILGLIPNMATTMIAPGIPDVVAELNINSQTVTTLATTIYLLGMALGPMFLSSLSETIGRAAVYNGANLVFIAFTIGNAESQTTAQFMVCRFFSGCAGGMPLALGGGSIADVTSPAQRGLATALFSLGPLAGPVLGPVIGGFLTAAKGWRWTCWLLAILAGAAEVATVILMDETSARMILRRKATRLRASTGRANLQSKFDQPVHVSKVLQQAVVRPTWLLLRSPILASLSIYAALVFGVIYLLFTTFDSVFQGQYGFAQSVSGLVYLGLGIALVLGVIIFAVLNPRIQTARMKADGVDQPRPEYRLLLMIWLSPLVAVGLFIYGWSAQYRVHWIVPIIGTFFIGLGAYFVLMPSQLYLIEYFGFQRAASALGAYNLLRYLGGTFLPLAGPSLYATLHLGWGNTLLGLVALVLVVPPIVFYRYGAVLRASDAGESQA